MCAGSGGVYSGHRSRATRAVSPHRLLLPPVRLTPRVPRRHLLRGDAPDSTDNRCDARQDSARARCSGQHRAATACRGFAHRGNIAANTVIQRLGVAINTIPKLGLCTFQTEGARPVG